MVDIQSKIHTQWHTQKQRVVYVLVQQGWTWAEMVDAAADIDNLLNSVTHDVYTLVDFSKANYVPQNPFVYLRQLNYPAPPNQKKVALVGLNFVSRSLINLFMRLYGNFSGSEMSIVDTIDDAYIFFDVSQID